MGVNEKWNTELMDIMFYNNGERYDWQLQATLDIMG